MVCCVVVVCLSVIYGVVCEIDGVNIVICVLGDWIVDLYCLCV